MPSYNKTILLGNLTRDPELQHLPGGTPVVRLGLAVNERYKDKQGEWVDRANFIDCEGFAKTAEIVAQYFKKGDPILVEGKLRQDQWEDRDTGKKRSKLKVVVERFEFVLPKSDRGGTGSSGNTQTPSKPEPLNEDDVPF
jgi:single-strand DNA-binding protein